MEIVPLGPGFAAELRGVTLAEIAADDAAYKETRAALEQHSVIVFRGQEVTDEAQLAFSRRFGPLEVTKVGSLGAGTNLVILSTIDENGKVVPGEGVLEPLPGEAGRDVFSLAAPRGNDARGKNRGQRRYALEGAVGVPELVRLVA